MKRILSLIGVVLMVGCGPPDGPFENYYDNGQLQEKGTFVAGELDGPYEFYYENGQLSEKSNFVAGELDGPFETYDENGQLRAKGTFKDNEQCGEWIEDGETVTYDPC